MKSKYCVIVLALFLVTMGGYAGAEEKFGVSIYPGAKFDSAATEFLKQISPESAAYRTGDKVEKVIAFYKKQPGLNFIVFRTSSQLEFDGVLLSFTDNNVGANSFITGRGTGLPAPGTQEGINNQVVIPITNIYRIVQYQ